VVADTVAGTVAGKVIGKVAGTVAGMNTSPELAVPVAAAEDMEKKTEDAVARTSVHASRDIEAQTAKEDE